MPNQINAEIDIDGNVFNHFTSLELVQDYHDHHYFEIRVPFNHMETYESIDLTNTHELVGKIAIIKFTSIDSQEEYLLFKGVVTGVFMLSADNFKRDILIKGHSPTIVLENGDNYFSHLDKDIPTIVADTVKPLEEFNVEVDTSECTFPASAPYFVQYNESSYNFLNRLANETLQLFYYDNTKLVFGIPTQIPVVEVRYAHDLLEYDVSYKVVPLKRSMLSYDLVQDEFLAEDAPLEINAQFSNISDRIFNTSHEVYSTEVQSYLKMAIENTANDLRIYVASEKRQRATNIKTVTGKSINPYLTVCRKMVVKVGIRAAGGEYGEQEQGNYFLTRVRHVIDESGRYYNDFEGVTSEINTYPFKKYNPVRTEVEMAKVVDNDDPENRGWVKVQTFWQQHNGEVSRWMPVMTPDAGGGDKNAGNRGFVAIPEVGDLILINYAMNNPNYPFVHGSMFSGKTGSGGGAGNTVKSITARNGATFRIDGTTLKIDNQLGDYIDVNDGNITIGTQDVLMQVKNVIRLEVGDSYIEILPDKITLHSPTIKIDAETADIQGKTKAVLKQTDGNCFKAEGNNAEIKGTQVTATATGNAEISGATTKINATGITEVKGATVNING